MQEDFTALEIKYLNDPFSKKDLEYIEQMNQEKFWFLHNLNLEKWKKE